MGNFFGGLVTLVIIIVGIVQALAPIFKSISEANEKRNRPPVPPPAAGRRQAVNPGSFLPEMVQPSVQRPVTVSPRPQGDSAQGRSQPPRSRKQSGGGTGKSTAKPSKENRSPGSGVGSHVDAFIGQHVKSHIGHQIDTSVKNDISDQVRNHLGEGNKPDTTSATATSHGSVAAADLLSALRSPAGVKQAILMSEILSKPKALRRS